MLEFLVKLDRRWIYLAIAVAALLPLLFPFGLPVQPTPEVEGVYETINRLAPRSVVLLSMDFDPASAPELTPMAKATLRQAMKKDLRVIGLTLWQTGLGIMDAAFRQVAEEMKREEGKDWVVLPYVPGAGALILKLGQDFKGAYPQDIKDRATADMEVLKGVDSLKNIDFQVEIAAGVPGISAWLIYGSQKCRYPMAAGATSVGTPEWFPYLQSKQIVGLMGGMRGAAEYEQLIDAPLNSRLAQKGLDALTVTSFLIILLVVVGNITYFMSKRKAK